MAADRIYLDYAATTPLRPEVREEMEPWLSGGYGNPSSQHHEGRQAKAALDLARERLCEALAADFAEVIFTSGATESANLGLVGLALANQSDRRKVLISAADHQAILQTQDLLERLGYEVKLLPVDRHAVLQPDTLEAHLDDKTLVVAALHTNNEFGSVNPIADLAAISHQHGALFCCDIVQSPSSAYKTDIIDADMKILSAHKLGGPKGAGALILRNGIQLKPLVAGGEQERERRGGTENVAGIVGFGKAITLDQSVDGQVIKAFLRELPASFVPSLPAPHQKIVHGRVPGLDAETVLIRLDRAGVAASSGAACSSGSVEPSHVMLAAGYTEAEAKEALRFSFGPGIDAAAAAEAGRRISGVIADLLAKRA